MMTAQILKSVDFTHTKKNLDISRTKHRTFEVSRTASYEIDLVVLSVRPPLRMSKFSQDWIISFSWYFTWWYLTMISSDWRSQIFEKKFWRPEFQSSAPKSGPKSFFLPFSWVWIRRFFLKLHTITACNNFQHLLEVKPTKNFGG